MGVSKPVMTGAAQAKKLLKRIISHKQACLLVGVKKLLKPIISQKQLYLAGLRNDRLRHPPLPALRDLSR